jgi:hypothetical protein
VTGQAEVLPVIVDERFLDRLPLTGTLETIKVATEGSGDSLVAGMQLPLLTTGPFAEELVLLVTALVPRGTIAGRVKSAPTDVLPVDFLPATARAETFPRPQVTAEVTVFGSARITHVRLLSVKAFNA